VQAETEAPDIYAVLYEAKPDANGNPLKLNGTNSHTDDAIISIAILSTEQVAQISVGDIDTDAYQYIEIPFEDRKPFEREKQIEGKYYITIVFSSSLKGDLFEGAVGSTFCIDKVQMIEATW
jgi:hypothetical protein